MKQYLVWFINNPYNRVIIEAKSRNEARIEFADANFIKVSSYICARPAK